MDEESSDSKTEGTTIVYDDETQKLIDYANNARNEYQDAEQQVKDVENEIKDIESYLEKDFGPEEEFAILQVKMYYFYNLVFITINQLTKVTVSKQILKHFFLGF